MTVYRAHFDDRRRESLRAKLEARHAVAAPPSELAAPAEAVVVPISRAAKES